MVLISTIFIGMIALFAVGTGIYFHFNEKKTEKK